MAKPLLSDELWEIIEPIPPKWTSSPKGGQPRLEDRKALIGVLFVLKTGIPWEDLPCEPGCGCRRGQRRPDRQRLLGGFAL
jgi:transposase